MGKETNIQGEIMKAIGGRSDCRIFRNNVGCVQDKKTEFWIHFGLFRGSADLIGWHTITVTPEMVGRKLAVFTSIEVKKPNEDAKKHQENWRDAVLQAGGIAGVARSPEEAIKLLEMI